MFLPLFWNLIQNERHVYVFHTYILKPKYLIYNYNMCVRACVCPTGQFRVLMDRRNRPRRSDSENGNPSPDD